MTDDRGETMVKMDGEGRMFEHIEHVFLLEICRILHEVLLVQRCVKNLSQRLPVHAAEMGGTLSQNRITSY